MNDKEKLKAILKDSIQENDEFREYFLINNHYLEDIMPNNPTKSKIYVNAVCFEFDEHNKLIAFYGIK